MNERSILFGSNNSLFGIVTDPQGDRKGEGRPAILLLNAGLMHHIGPFRLYVLLARALARLGFTVLRFDLSGKGDSTSRPGNLSYSNSVQADVKDAIDFLQSSRGLQKFILLGLCSGADDAYRCGLADERVAGVALLDGYAYRTGKFYLRYYLPRLLTPSKWLPFLKRILRIGRKRDAHESVEGDIFGMTFPPKREFESGMRKLLGRQASLLIVYSSGWFEYYNYPDQFQDAFPEIGRNSGVRLRYFEKADHTYAISADRRRLIECVCEWADESF